jgi:hypothetical protein
MPVFDVAFFKENTCPECAVLSVLEVGVVRIVDRWLDGSSGWKRNRRRILSRDGA